MTVSTTAAALSMLVVDSDRSRQAEALRRDGAVQAVRVEDLLARCTLVSLVAPDGE